MEDQYGIGDLRQYMNGRPLFTSIQPPPTDLLPRNLGPAHYEIVMGMAQVPSPHGMLPHHQHHEFLPDSTTAAATNSVTGGGTSSAGFSGLENMEAAGGSSGLCGDAGSGRWPRQETLTLLEVRSRLDSKFKEANQKGPVWDEVSRMMCEQHGYQRSGKKCKEKFENLYKYYKKTKEGKAGRQDGKHYRYFRQLEALYGKTSNRISISETNNITRNNQEAHLYQDSTKLSDSLVNDFDSTSSDDSKLNIVMDKDSKEKRKKKKRGKRSWKAKIRDFIDGQMRKLMEKQEAWLEKMMKTIEHKEQERILREEEWRKQEAIRIEKRQKFWADERAWIEARDAALFDALHKLSGEELKSNNILNDTNDSSIYKENWDGVNSYITKCNKKQRNNSLSSCYNFQNNEQGGLYCETSRHVPNIRPNNG